MKASCIECHQDFYESTAFDVMFCNKWCEKAWHDRNYVVPEQDDFVNGTLKEFQPYFNESHGIQVNSRAEERTMIRKHGGLLGDYPKQLARMNYTRKHREDIIAERYAKEGLRYPKGEKVNFDEKNGRFVPRTR